jgi:hypothetical protein
MVGATPLTSSIESAAAMEGTETASKAHKNQCFIEFFPSPTDLTFRCVRSLAIRDLIGLSQKVQFLTLLY